VTGRPGHPADGSTPGGMLAPLAEQSGLTARRVEDDVFEPTPL
jgi:hypothetical protein